MRTGIKILILIVFLLIIGLASATLFTYITITGSVTVIETTTTTVETTTTTIPETTTTTIGE
jgi:hypothetical protein